MGDIIYKFFTKGDKMAENAQGKEFNLEDLLKMGKGIFEQVKKETSKNLKIKAQLYSAWILADL